MAGHDMQTLDPPRAYPGSRDPSGANSPCILGLDPALSCGYALIALPGTVLDCGVWNLRGPLEGRKAEERQWRPGLRWGVLIDHLDHVLATYDVRAIAYELVYKHRSSRDAQSYGALKGCIELVAARYKKPIEGVPFSTVKKIATGSGSAKKPDMIRAVNALYGLNITDDDIADALWIAESLRRKLYEGPTAESLLSE